MREAAERRGRQGLQGQGLSPSTAGHHRDDGGSRGAGGEGQGCRRVGLGWGGSGGVMVSRGQKGNNGPDTAAAIVTNWPTDQRWVSSCQWR